MDNLNIKLAWKQVHDHKIYLELFRRRNQIHSIINQLNCEFVHNTTELIDFFSIILENGFDNRTKEIHSSLNKTVIHEVMKFEQNQLNQIKEQ